MSDQNKNKHYHTLAEKILAPIFLGIFIFIIISSLGYLGYTYAYQNKIYPGVKVAGYEVGGQTKDEAKKIIDVKQEKLKTTGINFTNSIDNSETNVSYDDLGISFDKETTLNNLLNIGKTGSPLDRTKVIVESLLGNVKGEITLNIDEAKFKPKINDLSKNQYKEAKNATYKIEDGELKIVNDEPGIEADYDHAKKAIKSLIDSENIYKNIIITTKNTIPAITVLDITPLKNEIESYLAKNITLSWEKNIFQPSKEQIINWLIITKDPNKNEVKITFSDETIKKYIEENIAAKIDKKAINKQVNSQNNEVIAEGQDGQVVNQNKALEQIKNALNSDKTQIALEVLTKEKEEVKVEPKNEVASGGTAGLADGKYIEINLSQQILYLFDGKNQIGAYAVSTGMWSMPTPTGTRYIQGKDPRAWSSKYGLYMPYWNDIGGGYGIHELPEWPGGYKEGEDHLGTPVSHGCIRLGVGSAETVYNWAPIGTAIFIH